MSTAAHSSTPPGPPRRPAWPTPWRAVRPTERSETSTMRRVFTLALAAGLPLIGAGIFGLTTPAAHADAITGPTLSVDLTADNHRISPDIYGMNFADEAL